MKKGKKQTKKVAAKRVVKKPVNKIVQAPELKARVAKADGYMRGGMSRVKAIHKAGLWYRQYLAAKKIKDLSKVKVGGK